MIVLADGSELRSPCLLDGRCLTEEREDARVPRVPARKAGAGGAVQRKYNVAAQSRVENADDMLSVLAGAHVGMALRMTLNQRIPTGPRGSTSPSFLQPLEERSRGAARR